MCTKFDITCILWHFPLCSIVLAQIAQIYIHICKFGTWTSNLFFYFIVTIRDYDVESLCYWCFLLIIFMSVSALPALEKLVIFMLICMQWLQSLLCPKVITIAFFMYCVCGNVTKFCETTLLNCEVFRSQSLWKLIHASAIYRKDLVSWSYRGDGRISPLMKVLHVLRRFCWLSPNLL